MSRSARSKYARADYTTARAYFERAERLTPNYSTLEINLGIVNGALGAHAVAEQHFTRALALSPDASSHFYYARWLTEIGRAPDAVPHLRESLVNSPGSLDARHLLMRMLAAQEADPELRRVAADTLAIDPRDGDAAAYSRGASPYGGTPEQTMASGLAALSARRFGDAAEWFRAGVLADARSADLWNNRGWAQYELGFYGPARASFARALGFDPKHTRAANNLQLVLKKGP